MATTTLTGTTGNDILNAPGSVTTLVAGAEGNDTITLSLAADEADGGTGDDSISIALNGRLQNTISGGAGSDTVTLTSAASISSIINLNDGDDLIAVTAGLLSNASIGGNKGNDTLTFVGGGNSGTVGGGANNDSIAFTAGTVTDVAVTGGGGKDTIQFSNAAANSLTTVQGGDGHDLILMTGAATFSAGGILAGGKGLDSMFLANGAVATIAGGGQSDTITFFSNIGVDAAIYGAGVGVTAGGSADTGDSITTTAAALSGVSIYGGAGNDTISFNSAGIGVLIDGGNDADLLGNTANLSLNASAVTISGGAGADTIALQDATAGSLILGGDGADSIFLFQTGGAIGSASINGGAGADTINVSVLTNTASTAAAAHVTVNGGAGSDSIMMGSLATNAGTSFEGGRANNAFSTLTGNIFGSVVYGSGDTIAIATTFNANAAANWVAAAKSIIVRSSLSAMASALTGAVTGQLAVFDSGDDMVMGFNAGGGAQTQVNFLRIIGGGTLIASGAQLTADAYTLNSSNFGFTVGEINAAGGINITFS